MGSDAAALADFRILGPLEVTSDGRRLDIGGAKMRELLAVLLLQVNDFVPASRLADALWRGDPPPSAAVTLRTHVSHLRGRLSTVGAGELLVTRPSGYGLVMDPAQLDAHRFERLMGQGQESLGLGDPGRAADQLAAALAEWRGPLLDDLGEPPFTISESARLGELRLVTLERRIDADLALGRDTVAELDQLVEAHPFRERFCGQLMVALYRAGRQVDALAAYSALRRRLADDLGLDVGPPLQQLETAILRHDPALLPAAAAVVTAPPRAPAAAPPDAMFAAAVRMPMVARADELTRLEAAWTLTSSGASKVVLVSGEAGIGKTRLVGQFAQEALEQGGTVLVGRCDALSGLAYPPLLAALGTSPEAQAVLTDAPEAIRLQVARLSSSDHDPSQDEAAERTAVVNAFHWVLSRIAAGGSTILVVEDAERIDRATSMLLRQLVIQLPDRVLVVISYRDPPGGRHEPLMQLLGDVAARGVPERLALQPLSEEGVAALVAELTSDAPSTFVRELWQHTGGNPYFVTEVVRDLGDGTRTWRVPAGVQDVLRQRLVSLPEPVQQVVRAAAVSGREIEFDLLSQVVEQDEDRVIESVERAVDAGFLIEAGRAWVGSYEFAHDLTRDAVYADIPLARRQRLHLRAAQALLARASPNLTAAATHLRSAGRVADPAQVAEVSLLAADQAARQYAWDEAIEHAEAAAAILDESDDPVAAGQAALRAGLVRIRSSIGFTEAVRHLEAALGHFGVAGDATAMGTVQSRLGGALAIHHSVMDIPRAIEHLAAAERTLADPGGAFHLRRGQAQAAMFGLRNELLGTAAEHMQQQARSSGRSDFAALADWADGWFEFNRGHLARADEHREAAWTAAHDAGDSYSAWGAVASAALCATDYLLDPATGRVWCRRGLVQPRFDTFAYPHAAVLDQLVIAQATMGDLAGARVTADRLPDDAVARRLLMFLDGEWENAERAWAVAAAEDEQRGDRHDTAYNLRWLSTARRHLGDLDGAIDALERTLALALDGPQVPTELHARAELARLLHLTGDSEVAEQHLARCDEILAGGEDWRGVVGAVELARALVHGSEDDFDTAIRVFTSFQLPWRKADALLAWGARTG